MVETRRRTKPAAERRRDLLEAATHVFAERGVTHATIEEIAVAAGVAKGTVYLYFESKEDLLAAIREEHAAEMLRRADRAFTVADADFEGGIDVLLRAIVDFQVEHAHLQDVICYAGHPSEVIAASECEVFRRFVEFVERGAEAGAFEVADAEATAALLYHAIHGALVQFQHEGSFDSKRFLAATSDFARRALSGRTHP